MNKPFFSQIAVDEIFFGINGHHCDLNENAFFGKASRFGV
jgi:hypothetical protein